MLLLQATSQDFTEGDAVLVLELVKEVSTSFKFNRAYYQADYPKTGTGNIELDIGFDNVDDVNKVTVDVESK